jgi:hypothetical protein
MVLHFHLVLCLLCPVLQPDIPQEEHETLPITKSMLVNLAADWSQRGKMSPSIKSGIAEQWLTASRGMRHSSACDVKSCQQVLKKDVLR